MDPIDRGQPHLIWQQMECNACEYEFPLGSHEQSQLTMLGLACAADS